MTTWRKSSHSGGGGGATDCVEMARLADGIGVRDSKNPAGPVLTMDRRVLDNLLDIIKSLPTG
ncbi:DUF397 domain-containing protein [Actinomadura vinacea]|uniref:DUF397 domain-containing protein n=1 Tax=Actinomadura vinacea TaxID=115336 RepID=A0ABP5XMZ3_9ACTN